MYQRDPNACHRCHHSMTPDCIDEHGLCDDCQEALRQRIVGGVCVRCGSETRHYCMCPEHGLQPRTMQTKACWECGRTDVGEVERWPDKLGRCPVCVELKRRSNHGRGGLTRELQNRAVRCPVCGEKGAINRGRDLVCFRCGHDMKIVNGIVAPIRRLSREEQHGALECPICGKKRLLALGARRYECFNRWCRVALLRSEEPDQRFQLGHQRDCHRKEIPVGMMETYDGRVITYEAWRKETFGEA